MRLDRLTDADCKNAQLGLITLVPAVGLSAIQASKLLGPVFAWSYVGVMGLLGATIGVMIIQSRKANRRSGQATHD